MSHENSNKCSAKNCSAEGEFSAPCDPQNLTKRQYFCAEHIKEFNKKWNGLDGFSEDDVFAMQTDTWDRPTWKIGLNSKSSNSSQFTAKSAEDLFNLFKQRRHQSELEKNAATGQIQLPPDVKEACIIFALDPPFKAEKLKKRYLSLIKKHHPDVNASSAEAEASVKRINVAFQILQDFIG